MGENSLGLDNILGEQDIDTLFSSPSASSKEEPQEASEEEKKEKETTEVENPEELFDDSEDGQLESVGSEKDTSGEKEDASTKNDSGASPNQNFYSSIANAMAVDGIFPNLTEDDIKKADDAESFSDLIEAEVNARLDDKQQRIAKALDNGVEANDIRKYEGTLDYINSITNVQLTAESAEGEKLRRNLIYQDFINKGYTHDKALKYTNRAINNGTDIDDAKDALQSNKEYFSRAYESMLQEAQAEADKETAERAQQAEKLKNSLMKDKSLFGDMEIDTNMRKKAFEAVSKPVYKDPETGDYLTAVQKYQEDHKADFLKYTGLFYALTNGFTDFNSFTKGKVRREMKKGLRELEHTFNSTSRDSNGNLRMVTSVRDDPNSYLGKGIKLDL